MAFEPGQGAEIAVRAAGADGEAVALGTCNSVCLYVAAREGEAARTRAASELAALAGLGPGGSTPSLYVEVRRRRGPPPLPRRRRARLAGSGRGPDPRAGAGGVRGGRRRRRRRPGRSTVSFARRCTRAGGFARETAIGETPASVSAAAADLAARVFDDLSARQVLLVGAGKMGELAAADLIARGVGSLVVANRSPERAAAIAERLGGRAVCLEQLEAEVAEADVVIASTGSQGLVLSAEQVERARRQRRGQPVFLIDIAVPRDLDPAINDLDGCYLYDIDDLERVVEESIGVRRDEGASAEAIVREEAAASTPGASRSTSSPRSRRCAAAPRRSEPRSSSARSHASKG